MLRTIPDLPPGVLGFEAVGEVHSDDYRDVLRPALDRAASEGGVRLVYVLGNEFTGYSAGASWQDARLAVEHVRAWERTAIVSDLDWVDHVAGAFGWMVPGEFRRFALAELGEAVTWTAGIEAPPTPEPAVVPVPAPQPVIEAEPSPQPQPQPQPTPVVQEPQPLLGGPQTLTPRAPLAPGADMRPGMVTPVPPTAPAVPEQWAADPSGRHQHRWWNGREWTEHVADNGVSGVDPLG
jgi:hypothetical protein